MLNSEDMASLGLDPGYPCRRQVEEQMKDEPKDPKPGTKDATNLGCKCPVIDNHHGKGWGGDGHRYGWCVDGECELHRPPSCAIAD